MSGAYDELSGSRGSKIFFRSRRYRARDLITNIPAVLLINHEPQELRDLSMNGISFFAQPGTFEVGGACSLSLRLDDAEVYRGEGLVSRLELTARGVLVGLRLTRGFLDIPGLVGRHDELSIRRDLQRGAADDNQAVPQSYRILCAEMLYVLRHYRSLCERTQKVHDPTGKYEIPDEVLSEYYERLEAEWTPLRHRAERLFSELQVGSAAFVASKRLTEAVLTPEFQTGVSGYRGYQKPLGYPGDFVLMNAFYAQQFEGDSAFGKLSHRLISQFPVAACVIPRMEMLTEVIANAVARGQENGHEGPVRIASLGSGPGREVQSYLASGKPKLPLHIVLIDQDEAALSHAYNQIYPLVSQLDNNSRVECLHISFAQLLKDPTVLDQLPPQDLVYSAGLVDYLEDSIADKIFSMLYRQLRARGTLVVGNMASNPGIGWLPEFLLDWTLLYRSEQDMRAFGERLDAAKIDVKIDRSGHTYLVYIQSP